ncbi:MAG: acyloxyacyl hydrolase [Candidatus Pedobacter colombiensis]|uniref:Acyloxyacyl hydrolase n=1 Tax=Candidatus Pedobacter colombiensis TaxID=3121371 RepID=A0AAJ5W8D3_9SPHI|nr:acyloxyacyl hydrolase [Pedobacter sp.]WEK19839.1 MAG: acyloxyacyl hydrolase [Pedobacter sp.]
MNLPRSVNLYFSLFFLGFLVAAGNLQAQEVGDVRSSIEFSPQVSVGAFTAEHKLRGTAYGGELIYHMNTIAHPRPWMKLLNLKSLDLVFNYKNMSDIVMVSDPRPNRFGDSYALIAALNFSLLKIKGTELLLTPGFGFGYLGETWFTNENILVGSHLNFSSRIALKLATQIGSSTKLLAGIDVLHFSNAAIRVPNNGMNVSSVSLGIAQSLNVRKTVNDTVSSRNPAEYKKHSVDFGVNIGRRGVYRSKDGLYKTGLYAGYNYRLNPVLALGAGVDAVYYHTIYDPLRNEETFQSKASSFDRWRVGAAIGPDLWLGRLGVMTKYGYYLHYNSLKDMKTYWTAGLKYQIMERLAVQAKMYLHQTEADFVGFGLIVTP